MVPIATIASLCYMNSLVGLGFTSGSVISHSVTLLCSRVPEWTPYPLSYYQAGDKTEAVVCVPTLLERHSLTEAAATVYTGNNVVVHVG